MEERLGKDSYFKCGYCKISRRGYNILYCSMVDMLMSLDEGACSKFEEINLEETYDLGGF